MRSIELQTTQNVRINYELALLRDRVIAFVIDFLAIGTSVLLMSIFTFGVLVQFGLELYFGMLVMAPFVTFYTLYMEWLTKGQTLGKMAMRIQVVRVDGKPMVFTDYLLRWVFRLLDVWFSGGAIAVVMISSSTRSQRLGDLVSNTTVVRTRPRMDIQLRDILKIGTAVDYTLTYPGIKRFREQDMITLKQTVERYLLYKNAAHAEALHLACKRVCDLLGIPEVPEDEVGFLRTVIKDYIVLTR
jgi:uncharacterized RDD family membrane protein YckC